jgi:hypothetical protein
MVRIFYKSIWRGGTKYGKNKSRARRSSKTIATIDEDRLWEILLDRKPYIPALN